MKVYSDPIELIQSSLGITPEVLYSVDVNSVSFREFMISVIDSEVSFTHWIYKSIICFPSIRIEDRFIKIYFSLYDWPESCCFTVWNNFGIDFHSPIFILSFNQSEYWLFLCSSSSLEFSGKSSLSFGSEVAFINFYFSSYFLSKLLYSIKIYDLSEYTKVSIDCLSIIPEEFTGFCSIYIYAKVLDNFFQFMFTDFTVWNHKKRVYELFSSGLEPFLYIPYIYAMIIAQRNMMTKIDDNQVNSLSYEEYLLKIVSVRILYKTDILLAVKAIEKK